VVAGTGLEIRPGAKGAPDPVVTPPPPVPSWPPATRDPEGSGDSFDALYTDLTGDLATSWLARGGTTTTSPANFAAREFGGNGSQSGCSRRSAALAIFKDVSWVPGGDDVRFTHCEFVGRRISSSLLDARRRATSSTESARLHELQHGNGTLGGRTIRGPTSLVKVTEQSGSWVCRDKQRSRSLTPAPLRTIIDVPRLQLLGSWPSAARRETR